MDKRIMKYAITGPRGRIFNILDEEPQREHSSLTDEQAVQASEGIWFIVEGELKTQAEFRVVAQAQRQAERMTELYAQDPAQAKAHKRQALSDARYQAEIGGTTFNGIPLRTDRQTQATLTSAMLFAQADANFTTDWKLGDGQFITLDAATVIGLAGAVLSHVQTQFTREKDLNALVDSATTAEELNTITW